MPRPLSNRQVTAMRHIFQNRKISYVELARLFLVNVHSTTKIVKNKAYRDTTYQAFLSGVQDKTPEKIFIELMAKHPIMKNWDAADTWRYFIYNEEDWFPD